MTKKKAIISLSIISLIGSIITFYAGNLLSSDISNYFKGKYVVSTPPFLMISLYFILALLFVIRYYRYENRRKSLVNLYTILFAIASIVGIIFDILCVIVYHSIVAKYPFVCYPLIMLIVHLAVLVLSIIANIHYNKTMDNDTEVKKIKFKYVLNTIVMVILIFMAFYRLGSVLWAPVYLQARTLYLTFSFYLWILLPMALVIHIVLYFLNVYKNYKQSIIYTGILFGLNLVLGLVVILIGKANPLFISAISPALPLERLATMPLDTIIEFSLMAIISGYYLFYSIRSYVREIRK